MGSWPSIFFFQLKRFLKLSQFLISLVKNDLQRSTTMARLRFSIHPCWWPPTRERSSPVNERFTRLAPAHQRFICFSAVSPHHIHILSVIAFCIRFCFVGSQFPFDHVLIFFSAANLIHFSPSKRLIQSVSFHDEYLPPLP